MAATINVAGLASCNFDTGTSNALELLGYTRNGVEITDNGYFLDVHTDLDGGDDGPPSDSQYLGGTCTIRMEFTKYDDAVRAKIDTRLYGGTSGTNGAAGTLMIQGAKTFRVCIFTPTTPYNFPICMLRDPIDLNKGTKYSTLVIIATAYRNSSTGVVRNSTTSGAVA